MRDYECKYYITADCCSTVDTYESHLRKIKHKATPSVQNEIYQPQAGTIKLETLRPPSGSSACEVELLCTGVTGLSNCSWGAKNLSRTCCDAAGFFSPGRNMFQKGPMLAWNSPLNAWGFTGPFALLSPPRCLAHGRRADVGTPPPRRFHGSDLPKPTFIITAFRVCV